MPVLWVTGAPGIGTSTVGWGLFEAVAARGGVSPTQEGLSAAFVDAQQVGFVHPRPSDAFVRAQISTLVHGSRRAGATVALLVTRLLEHLRRSVLVPGSPEVRNPSTRDLLDVSARRSPSAASRTRLPPAAR